MFSLSVITLTLVIKIIMVNIKKSLFLSFENSTTNSRHYKLRRILLCLRMFNLRGQKIRSHTILLKQHLEKVFTFVLYIEGTGPFYILMSGVYWTSLLNKIRVTTSYNYRYLIQTSDKTNSQLERLWFIHTWDIWL